MFVDSSGGVTERNMAIDVPEYLGIRPSWVEGSMVGGSVWQFMLPALAIALLIGGFRLAMLGLNSMRPIVAARGIGGSVRRFESVTEIGEAVKWFLLKGDLSAAVNRKALGESR